MVVLKEIPKVPSPVASKGCKEDVEKIRQWDRTYGDSTRQLSVRAKSTKDNPGTMTRSAFFKFLFIYLFILFLQFLADT